MEKHDLHSDENKYTSAKHKKKRRNKIITCLAAAVVFCTSYALILPAITMEKEICDIDHEHTEECRLAEESENNGGLLILEDDGAYVSRLATGAITISGEDGTQSAITAGNSGTVSFDFTAQTASYNEQPYDQGRIKFEFALPLSSEQAVFDVSAMTWIDGGTAAAVQTTEQREIDGQTVECQILSCYSKLESKNEDEPAIPGEFTESAVITVLNMEAGEEISLGITAAMEFNAWDGKCETHGADERLTAQTASCAITETVEENDAGEPEQEAVEIMAEPAYGDNWKLLRDSGWFEEYAAYADDAVKSKRLSMRAAQAGDDSSSSEQVDEPGGTNTNEDDKVSVSKTIEGTELENVFDITLQVNTTRKIEEVISEPDMAVVIVMDISNTMNDNFEGVTRYAAAMEAAENFLDQFAESNILGVSKVGYVAFNTDAHEIFGLQPCTNADQANTLKNTMRTETKPIITASGYRDAHNRFTNIEAGLKMASDMLDKASNKNKYIIFLSDGFPTTYIESGYKGYDPYDSTGNFFYDKVLDRKCLYGTSYSDEAAIRARKMAASIKAGGTKIFSIGVDVGGQTIQEYITSSEKSNGFSVVDRTGTTYEIGDANSTEAYKTWLKNSIGSGYYYDSTNTAGLTAAYTDIFETIKEQVATGSQADWVAADPLPTIGGQVDKVEFIGFYNKDGNLTKYKKLEGQKDGEGKLVTPYTENFAEFDDEKYAIEWDLKKSCYETKTEGGSTVYTYKLKYRVRLKNEEKGFNEYIDDNTKNSYPTNDTTTLTYRVISEEGGNLTVSKSKTIEFPIPSVHGYLGELKFQKVGRIADEDDAPLSGAEFTLSHDPKCNICRGDGTRVDVSDMTAESGSDGIVSFEKIPSGHKYILKETVVPAGYVSDGYVYTVTVAYDETTVEVKKTDGSEETWKTPNGENGIYGTIENRSYYELPSTGGSGTMWYTTGGLMLIISSAVLLLYKYQKRRKEDPESS